MPRDLTPAEIRQLARAGKLKNADGTLVNPNLLHAAIRQLPKEDEIAEPAWPDVDTKLIESFMAALRQLVQTNQDQATALLERLNAVVNARPVVNVDVKPAPVQTLEASAQTPKLWRFQIDRDPNSGLIETVIATPVIEVG